MIGLQAQAATQDVAGDVCGAHPAHECMRAQPDQRLDRLDVQLRDDHAGGLADLGTRELIELGPRIAVRVGNRHLFVLGEQIEQRQFSQLGGNQGAG